MVRARGNRRRRQAAILALALAAAAPAAQADDDDKPAAPSLVPGQFGALDTKNLFGFLEGADVGEKGDRSVEFETTGGLGKPEGVYR